MFLPPHFAEADTEIAVGMCRVAGFGHLVVNGSDGPMSTPMPFVLSDDGTSVRAHLARPNPSWRVAPCRALLVVPIADAYVSPSWYPSKTVDGKVVPTWNYEVVHAHGELRVHDDAEWLLGLLHELTDLHESSLPEPWAVDDAPADHVDRLLQAIVGVELVVDRLVAKRKLSQNRSAADRSGVIDGLTDSPARGAARIRAAMEQLDPR